MLRKKVLVLGDYRQTVTVVRSLGRAGFDVVLGCEQPHSSTALSRHVRSVRRFDSSSPERYCESVAACLAQEHPDYVFPVGEAELRRVLRGGSHALGSLATWIMPDAATVLRCFDKRAMYHVAAALGVPVPAWRPYRGLLGTLHDAEELNYPVVVKRKDSSTTLHGRNAVICHSFLELEQFLLNADGDPDRDSLLVQSRAPGERHNCHFAAQQGRIVAFFQQKVLRTDGPEGTGIGIEGISVAPSTRLRAYCDQLIGHLQYHGIGCIQFLVDPQSGAIAFLELNARMDSTAVLPYRLGIDFPLMALRIAAGAPVHAPPAYEIGKRYYYLYGNLNAWLAQRRTVRLEGLLGRALTVPWTVLTTCDLVLDWRDPLPAVHQFGKRALMSALKLAQRPQRKSQKATLESGVRT
jgi:predicted ATP-grasp superfamily ATP-dependent carboligase